MYIAQSKHPSVAEQHRRLRAAEVSVRNAAAQNGWVVPATRREELRERVEECSGGRNTVLYTDDGAPGIYVRVPADKRALPSDIASECGLTVGVPHPAFRAGGKLLEAVYVGKYQSVCANMSTGELETGPDGTSTARRMLSLPGLDPVADIDYDATDEYCRNNGDGYHMVSNAEWSWLYLLTLAWGWEPRGNTNDGRDYVRSDEQCAWPDWSGGDQKGLTGTGPVAWTHDGTPYGVWDLCGNVWEWCGGLRWQDGEVQIIPNNDVAVGADQSSGSAAWRAIDIASGDLVNPATAPAGSTLRIDTDGSAPYYSDTTTQANDSRSTQYGAITSTVVVPHVAKALGLYPLTAASPARGRISLHTGNERVPLRGGHWGLSSDAGVAALYGFYSRGSRAGFLGGRSAFAI